MAQLRLFGYFCQNCRQTVPHTQRTRRFWLCDACWAAVVPAWTDERIAENSQEQRQVAAYWSWYHEMERLYPARRGKPSRKGGVAPSRTTDSYYPLCECGRERKEYEFAGSTAPRSLFGGSRAKYCPMCEARRSVEGYLNMSAAIHPDWDDETWLDMLYRVMPAAFALGVLPDYWYTLRRGAAQREVVE